MGKVVNKLWHLMFLFVVIPTKKERGSTSSYAHVQHYFLTKNEDMGFMSNVQGENLNPIFK
jgi:hypothetical protein